MHLLGASTSNKIQVVTDAAADIEAVVSYMDGSTSTWAVNGGGSDPLPSITTATTTDLIAGAASTLRSVRHISLRNNHASTSVNVTVQATDGTDTVTMAKANLLAGESLIRTSTGVWIHYDSNGGQYPSVGNAATQAEMEAGTATDRFVTPQGVNWHPGVSKFWVKAGVTGNVLASWNVTSLTDNGTGDITVTIGTDFSSADWCAQVSVEMTATTYGVANTREPHIRSAGQAAGTVRCDCVDNTATTSLIKDPTAWHISGLGDQ